MTEQDPEPAIDISEVTEMVLEELDAPTMIGDKMLLTRRHVVGLAGGSLGLGALVKMMTSPAQAQSGDNTVGTDSERLDWYAGDIDANSATIADLTASNYGSESVTGGYELTIDGDTYQFNE